MSSDKDSVQVAVRLRPLITSEITQGYKNVLEVWSDIKQIKIKDSQLAFTYNHVYDTNIGQETFYNTCVKDLLDNLFKGYNLTILAYGQTGSGKTYSMGTTYDGNCEMGIIPRAITDIFAYVNDQFSYNFTITASFIEIYQETVYDLLAQGPKDQCSLEIREDSKGIVIPGLTEVVTSSAANTMLLLTKGSSSRATASTDMNTQSSRSHAIFTINISMQKKNDPNSNKTAKFHLVDLAGSERSKKTGATGQVFREGVHINKGLLALGNVISALGDEKTQGGYICYRESNLTRLLKDSLGGNSITLMICCVSPADYNYQETISTLRYADRARKIKNKPVVNQDPNAAEINRLHKLVQQLRLELVGQGGSIICQSELDEIRQELEALKVKNRELTMQLSCTLCEKTALHERILMIQSANEEMYTKFKELKDEYNSVVNTLKDSFHENGHTAMQDQLDKLHFIENLFTNLGTQLTKNDEEIKQHDLYGSFVNTNHDDTVLDLELGVEQENHMKKQVAINSEFQKVAKMLAMKEYLAQKILDNSHHLVNYSSITENELKIKQLQAEKDNLLKQLKEHNATEVTNKLGEQRRVRVLELEKQIHDLQKKVSEQARMIKLKEKDEQKIKQLNREIQDMKQTKVKLIRAMKQESDQFNSWKQKREREFMKLKDQDCKRLNQIKRMEGMHNRQQNVLRRKVEEAAALNKRLKDSLALRKNVQEQKNFGKAERVVSWIQQEIDIVVNTINAESTISQLMEERATLTKYLDELNQNTNLCDVEQIRQVEEDIEMRSAQIQELQQKILDSDQENKSKTRWDNIHTMADTKFALKAMFDLITESRLKNISKEQKIKELVNTQEQVNCKLDVENNLQAIKAEHAKNISELQKEYEEKISLLLRQLRGVTFEGVEEQLKQQCHIQQDTLKQLELTNDELQLQNANLIQEIEDLEKKMKNQLPGGGIKKINFGILKKETELEESNHVSDESDSKILDPDWHRTPLAKRLKRIKSSSQTADDSRLTVKRLSDGSCACKSNCSKRCGCRRQGNVCHSTCKCSEEKCLNRIDEKENVKTETNDVTYISNGDMDVNSGESIKRSRIMYKAISDTSTIFEESSQVLKI